MGKHRSSVIEHERSTSLPLRLFASSSSANGFIRSLCLCLVSMQILSATAQETLRQYLSGQGKDDAVPWKFMCTSGANSGVWTNLPVPSQWDMHGFGTLNYRTDATNAFDERGLYEREFQVPSNLNGKRIFLVFDGVMTDTSAKVNGQSVGPTHQGSFYRFKYEITPFVKFGQTNLLEVTVARHSANASVNNAERLADYWVFAGIFRPVSLEAQPAQFIDRVAIDAQANGDFAMDVFTDGATNAETLEAQILSNAGQPIGETFSAQLTGDGKTHLQSRLASPLTWSAETPNLYRVEVRLKRGNQLLHRFQERFGFRTMEIRDGDGFYVNGRRVVLKGANRHSFWPDSGRCLSENVHRLDIETLKDMNMNAVRMSHYPPDARFLELCDELGLYVLDELAGWHKDYDTEVGTRLVKEMVVRDVNHPCILFWDNGNEGGWNTKLDGLFAQFDPQQRRVLHPWSPFSGVNTSHYLPYKTAQLASEGVPTYREKRDKPVATDDTKFIYMPTEFMHALYDGGAGAGLEDYWRMMTASKYLGGGFIWALTDDAVKRPDTGGLDAAGNQAPDGIVGPYREREASFYTIKEIWSPIQIKRESSQKFTVENHYSFTDAKQCKFTWQYRKYPALTENGSDFTVVAEDVLDAPAVPPGGKAVLKMPLLKTEDRFDAWALRVDDPTGRELWTWVWPKAKIGDLAGLMNEPAPQKATGTENADAVEIKSGKLSVTISRQTGLLTQVVQDGQTFSVNNGPRLASKKSTLKSFRAEPDGPDYIVSAKFDGDLQSILWRVCGNGWVRCEYKYSAAGTNDFLGVISITRKIT
ncbi:MAG: glycoside hydrolase family 2 protein [Verrucomicrobiota bacterium]